MKRNDFETIKKRLTRNYQLAKRTLLRTEKKNIDTPTQDLERQCMELRGYLRGLKRCIEFVEERINDNDLFSAAG